MAHQAKFRRSFEHFKCLEDELTAWAKKGAETFPYKPSHDGEKYLLTYVGTNFPAERLSILVGDFAQNLRARLDHLAYELAVANRGTLTDKQEAGSEFPIFWKGTRIPPDMRVKKIGCICKCGQTFIEREQPYKAGLHYRGEMLWKIHELSIIDKHRLLHPVIARPVPSYIGGENVTVLDWQDLGGDIPEEGAPVASFRVVRTNPDLPMHMKVNIGRVIAFADGPMSGEIVLRALRLAGQYVEEKLIAVLEPHLGPKPHPALPAP
jgi:hypothetical protein